MYEILTGVKPFEAKNPQAYLAKHLTEAPKPLAETNPLVRVSPAVEDIVMRMLAKKREPDPSRWSVSTWSSPR